MSEAARRVVARKRILDLIARRRTLEGDDNVGRSVERQLISRELADLEIEENVNHHGIESLIPEPFRDSERW